MVASKSAPSTLPLRQKISSYAFSALTAIQLRSFYDLSDGGSDAAGCFLKPLLCKSVASQAQHQLATNLRIRCII